MMDGWMDGAPCFNLFQEPKVPLECVVEIDPND